MGNSAEVEAFVRRRLVRSTAQCDVFGMHLVPTNAARRRDAAVHLMERAFAQQHDELHLGKLTRAPEQVMVREAATRQYEGFVDAVELFPERFRHEQSVALTRRS